MNKEVVKAMQGKKEHKVRKWWHKNGYKVWRVVLFPLWFGMQAWNKINKRLNDKQEWSEERAHEIFEYYVPRRADWNDNNKCFYYFDNGGGWNLSFAKKFLKRKDYRFWKVNCGWWGGKMRDYLINKFELEGFTKEVYDNGADWTDVSFKLNTQNQ